MRGLDECVKLMFCTTTSGGTNTVYEQFFLPCYKPFGYGWTMTSPRKARLLNT